MPIERPLVPKLSPEQRMPTTFRAMISPCAGCPKGSKKVSTLESDVKSTNKGAWAGDWPCPKQFLIAQRLRGGELATSKESSDWQHPIYDQSYLAKNPVWAGVAHPKSYDDGQNTGGGEVDVAVKYSYAFVATYEDNYDNGWNPTFDQAKIRCRGPYIIAAPERLLNMHGHLNERDHVLGFTQYYYLDGVQFYGYLMEATTWKVSHGETRPIDTNLIATTPGSK